MPWLRRVLSGVSSVNPGLVGARIPLRSRVLWLGLLCWASTNLLPLLHRRAELPGAAFVGLALAPCALAGGLLLAKRRSTAATYTLLTAFPIAIALSLSALGHELALTTFSPGVLLFGLASLAGYGAAASQLGAGAEPERAVQHKPLGEAAPVATERRRQWVGLMAVSVVTAGSCISLCFATWNVPFAYRENWGQAASQGAVLSAMAAGVIGCAAIALVAPGLRAQRQKPARPEQRIKRLTQHFLAALSFTALYLLLRR